MTDNASFISVLRRLVRSAIFIVRGPEGRVATFLAVVAIVAAATLTGHPEQHQHLGAEYYKIAQALADGRGYSDPFGESTGPTAWMPPVFCALQWLFIVVLEERRLVAIAVLVLMYTSFVIVGTAIYSVVRSTQPVINPLLIVAMYVVWALGHRYWFFVLTSDVWLHSLLVAATVWALARYASTGTLGRWYLWALLGGIAFLTSPAVAAAWMVILGCIYFHNRAERVHIALVLGAAFYLASPWIIRNAIVFHQFIPTKSNLVFELHQANVVDDDGIYDLATMQHHPYNQAIMRFQYGRLGEKQYVRAHGEQFFQAVEDNPQVFLDKVLNRLVAATVRYTPLLPQHESPAERFVKRLLYPLPVCGLITCALFRRRNRFLVGTLALFSATYLLPFIIVAFYERYLLPLTPAIILCVFFGIDHIVGWLRSNVIAVRALP